MSYRAPQHRRDEALAGYQRYQREIRSGNGGVAAAPRPREFDENGFPVPQRTPSFLERVGRILNPL
jgi:hypothetical protein